MRVVLGLWTCALAGCMAGPYVASPALLPPAIENPVVLAVRDHQAAWEIVVDVVDDYFRIHKEEPVRCVGNQLTEGFLETFPETGATILEPWRRDSATPYQRLESTLQSIRRRAVVRVMPAEGGYRVEVNVFKELEEVARPEGTTGDATFRYDTSLTRVVDPVGEQEVNEGWIPLGRDAALEQRIIADLLARTGTVPVR